MSCVWEGNRRSCVAGHASQTSVVFHIGAHGLKNGVEHTAYTSFLRGGDRCLRR